MSIKKGDMAEKAACQFLKKQGLTFIEKNFHSRFGEIDLIMQDNTFLVFIEVRYRKTTQFGTPAETVNLNKKQKLIKTAYCYLALKNKTHIPFRFDIVGITPNPDHSLNINWIKGAFGQGNGI